MQLNIYASRDWFLLYQFWMISAIILFIDNSFKISIFPIFLMMGSYPFTVVSVSKLTGRLEQRSGQQTNLTFGNAIGLRISSY